MTANERTDRHMQQRTNKHNTVIQQSLRRLHSFRTIKTLYANVTNELLESTFPLSYLPTARSLLDCNSWRRWPPAGGGQQIRSVKNTETAPTPAIVLSPVISLQLRKGRQPIRRLIDERFHLFEQVLLETQPTDGKRWSVINQPGLRPLNFAVRPL